jgi:hypothetical protein
MIKKFLRWLFNSNKVYRDMHFSPAGIRPLTEEELDELHNSIQTMKDDLKKDEEMKRVYQYIESNSEPLGPEFQKVLNDNFWELLVKNEDCK